MSKIEVYILIRWQFKSKNKTMGFFLRYGDFDMKRDKDLSIIFEFIIHTRESDNNVLEISSCFGEAPLFYLYDTRGEMKIDLLGGSPQTHIPIYKDSNLQDK